MCRLAAFVIPAVLFLASTVSTAKADTPMRVVRHDGYDAWRRLEARLDRAEAYTDLVRARARSIEADVKIKSAALEHEREARRPQGERTLGRACIYGPDDEVLYQPAGKRCLRASAPTPRGLGTR